MGDQFSAGEVLQMAEQIEQNAATFYRDAVRGMLTEDARSLLLRLAAMEDDHARTFAAMRATLSETEKHARPNDEAVAYLRALADTRGLFARSVDTSSMEEVLKAAILAEKDSIAFYTGLREIVPESLGKGRIDDVIRQEMTHIRLLVDVLMAC
jgi:rubrerythrin